MTIENLERLRRFSDLADGLTFTTRERNRLIRELHASSVPVERIAEAASISRQRVYQILEREET